MTDGGERRAGALVPIVAAACLLAGAVGVALMLGGGESGEAPAPPEACLRAWNADPGARALGRHALGDHDYRRAEVTRLDAAGEPAGPEGDCAVIFPSASLDPEPVAAALVRRGGTWVPLAQPGGVGLARLAELQSEALQFANAIVGGDGGLTAEGES